MKCDAIISPASIHTTRYAPYNTSLASSASSSLSSVWSDTTSQTSDDISISALSCDSDSCDSYFSRKAAVVESAVNFRCRPQKTQTDTLPTSCAKILEEHLVHALHALLLWSDSLSEKSTLSIASSIRRHRLLKPFGLCHLSPVEMCPQTTQSCHCATSSRKPYAARGQVTRLSRLLCIT
jgi:hypothetical protein